jgi:cytochrome c553
MSLGRIAGNAWQSAFLASHVLVAFCISMAGESDVHPESQSADPSRNVGEAIYSAKCRSCHGKLGEGVKGKHEVPLMGDLTTNELARLISETMPEDKPGTCIGDEAQAVAAFVYQRFYSEAAQVRNRPPRIGLARLTASQMRQTLADLYASVDGVSGPQSTGGATGIYFNDGRWKNDKKVLQRIDPTIDFDFGRDAPVEGIDPEEFYIYWDGSLKVDETGRYEIVVESTCSFVMDFGKFGRQFIDNHVQSGDKTNFRKSIQLTAGRLYPFKIDFIQRKRKTELPPARISMRWVRPSGLEEVIPARNLIAVTGPPAFSLQASLPPDDRSYGFERGITVNRQWDDAVTASAVEFADIASDELWPRYREKHRKEPGDDRAKLKAFLIGLIENAFGGPGTAEMQSRFVDRHLEATADDAEAIKLVLLSALKSPYFLYAGIDSTASKSQRAANRLSLTLWDSAVGDDRLRSLVKKEKLSTELEIREAAERLALDIRTQAKLRSMLLDWLAVTSAVELNKDEELFPGFDKSLVFDLRSSFESTLDELMSRESFDFRSLFRSDQYFTTSRLEEFYGEDWKAVEDLPFGKKTKPMPERNFGLLTHPYLMSRLAYRHSTSPIHRGVFLIRYMLGRNLKPPNEAFTPLSPDLHPDLTTRERVALQTQADNCQSCHIKINGLGFTLENFDAVGRFRETERNKSIDPRGAYVDRTGQEIELNGAGALANYLADSNDSHRAFVNRAFQFFVKQPAAAYGADRLEELTDFFRKNDFNVKKLIVEIAVTAAMEQPKKSEQNLSPESDPVKLR